MTCRVTTRLLPLAAFCRRLQYLVGRFSTAPPSNNSQHAVCCCHGGQHCRDVHLTAEAAEAAECVAAGRCAATGYEPQLQVVLQKHAG